jgi:hypothetical protein
MAPFQSAFRREASDVFVRLEAAAFADAARRGRALRAFAGAGAVAAIILGRAAAFALARKRPFLGGLALALFLVELRFFEHGVEAEHGNASKRPDHEVGEAAVPLFGGLSEDGLWARHLIRFGAQNHTPSSTIPNPIDQAKSGR